MIKNSTTAKEWLISYINYGINWANSKCQNKDEQRKVEDFKKIFSAFIESEDASLDKVDKNQLRNTVDRLVYQNKRLRVQNTIIDFYHLIEILNLIARVIVTNV
jgi:hypothetical protein